MKKNILYIIFFCFITVNSFAKISFQSQNALIDSGIINKNMNCNKLVDLLGGLNQIELLWLGNVKDEKFQYALINNIGKNTKKIFYLCENSLNKKNNSDKTLEVLSNRNLMKIYYNSSDLFADIFSLTSKESRNYIMSTLNLQSFNISKNEINQAYIAGLMKINQEPNKVVIKKPPKKITTTNTKSEKQKFIKKIEKLTPGDYYLFGHSTSGEKFWGSTQTINRTLQAGKVYSSDGRTCYIRSEQKTKNAPFKGVFLLKCGNEKINGSWTQKSAYSPGIGEGFNDSGDVIRAFFSSNQLTIIDFASNYFDSPSTEIANVTEPKEEEFVPKKSSDKTPPKIIIAKSITVNNYSYILKGKVKDTGSKNLYIEIDGMIQQANNGEFSFKRFSPIDEKVTIVAIDQWGNRSKATTVNIIMDIKNTEVVKKIEKLDPFKIKANKLNNNKVALIIGIENYAKSPNATYANLDAKYFYEYVKNTFGVKTENIKLMINQEANLVDSLGALNKWLPGKVRKNQTDLIIYFAGHGLASSDGKELYLLPQDGDTDLLERTALSRTEIFKMITKLSPKSVTMFLDTCYSGVSRDEETLLASARPVRIVADEQDTPDNFTIFTASQLDQISSGFKEAKHGIFSYYLMKGLEGKADANKDKKITNGELLAYMDQNVAQKASELGRLQNPSLAGDPDKILMSYR